MANSALQGNTWDIPEELHGHLKRTITAYKGDKNVEGYQRLKTLVDTPKVSYEQLKRIKNFFDGHSKTDYVVGKKDIKQDTQYILNGGSKMKSWVYNTLNDARSNIKNPKEIKKDAGWTKNQFQKDSLTNTRGISKNPTKVHSSSELSEQKGMNRDIYIKDEIKMMKSLINIFDKNKQLWHTDK